MLVTICKYLALFFCSIYTTSRLVQPRQFRARSSYIVQAIVLTLCCVICKGFFGAYFALIPFILYLVSECICIPNTTLAVTVASISYCLNQILYSLFSVIVAFGISLFWKDYDDVPLLLSVVIISILQPVGILLLFKNKRLQNGMSFLYSSKLFTFILCTVVLSCVVTDFMLTETDTIYPAIFQIAIALLFVPLTLWWRRQITKSYRRYLRELELSQLHQQIELLTRDNERLSQIVHKDNKLVSAMTSTVMELLQNAPRLDPKELRTRSSQLYYELSDMSAHRRDLLTPPSESNQVAPQTSHRLVDSILSYEIKNARRDGVDVQFEMEDGILTQLNQYLSDEELAHLLGDLIQNALIALSSVEQKALSIRLQTVRKRPTISIADSGADFPINVLQNYGIRPCSSHLDEGGSGIGLMDVWKIKQDCKATLLIKEYPNTSEYTKQINLIFDNKNGYFVFTNRKEELTSEIHRPDLRIEELSAV